MSRVETSITIAAPPEEVWAIALDPWRLGDWVTIHRETKAAPEGSLNKGDRMRQTMAIRGAPFDVEWELTEFDPPHHAIWTGKGPARSKAVTEYRLTPDGDGTLFEYVNEFKAPGGIVGALASTVVVGSVPEDEAKASLKRLKAIAERETGH